MPNYTITAGLHDRRTGVRGTRGARKLRAVETAYILTGKDSTLTKTVAASTNGTFFDRSVTYGGTTFDYKVFVPGSVSSAPHEVIVALHSTAEAGTGNLTQVGFGTLGEQVGYSGNPTTYAADVAPFGVARWNTIVIFPQYQTGGGAFLYNFIGAVPLMLAAAQAEWSCDADRIYITGVSGGGFRVWPILYNAPTTYAGVILLSANIAAVYFSTTNMPGWVGSSPATDTDAQTMMADMCADNNIAVRWYTGSVDTLIDPALQTTGAGVFTDMYATAGISSKFVHTIDNPLSATTPGQTFGHGDCWKLEYGRPGCWTDLLAQHK